MLYLYSYCCGKDDGISISINLFFINLFFIFCFYTNAFVLFYNKQIETKMNYSKVQLPIKKYQRVLLAVLLKHSEILPARRNKLPP